ncbi:hypothetical protein BH09BAC2_BH09BAC2_06480 [soil metagenome]
MSSLLKNIIRFLFFLFLQVFVLNQIPVLHHLVNPYVYFVFILWLPFKIGRRTLLIAGFLCGLSLDFFTKTPGFHAAACVFIAYLRPFTINFLISQQGTENTFQEPSFRSLGFGQYTVYLIILTTIHHMVLFSLQLLQFSAGWYLTLKLFLSLIVSLLLILILELLFVRKQKFRTNS